MSSAPIREIKVKASGRICLFGDHQDYLGFPVIASTIDRDITIEGRANSSGLLNIDLPDIDQKRTIDPTAGISALEKRDYLLSGLKVMLNEGLVVNIGYDISISGDIPINSGLSSSSALCVAWIRFLVRAYSQNEYSPIEIGALAYKAEVTEHGEPGGIMDQYTIAHEGMVHIETASPFKVTPIDRKIPGLVIADSGEEKGTLEVLQKAKEGGLMALDHLKNSRPHLSIKTIRSQHIDDVLDQCPNHLQSYLKAAIGNHDLTRDALSILNSEKPDLVEIGSLLNAHQKILRDDLGVSTSRLDCLMDAALGAGALGAKLIGSGGGGCLLTLAPGNEEAVKQAMEGAGAKDVFLANV